MTVQAGTREMWDLVQAAQLGDADALGSIYDRYVDLVFQYCCLRTGVRSAGGHLTAVTFRTARQRHFDGINSPAQDVGAWLLGIARSEAVAYDTDLIGPAPVYDVAQEPADLAVLAAARQLSPDQQDCIVLRILMGRSVAYTCDVMGRKPGAMGVLQYRALRALARRLPEGIQL